ncbi:hypothetical protein [Hymenobacter sp. 102]|uniref:hypothetical protein n=1 Tax=Hymenobacter sp. 102 TaxID=3403152 RepID=UPI003CE8CB01
MKKNVLTLSAILVVCAAAQAQWVQQPFSFTPTSRVPLYVDAVDASTAWSLSSGILSRSTTNQVARTFNGGQNWTVLTIAAIDTDNETIQSLSAISPTTAWVVTAGVAGGRILKTADAGNTWVVQSTAAMFTGPDSYPNTIHFFNANDGVVMGDPDDTGRGMEIYYTANGGTSWTRATVPVGTKDELGTIAPPAVVGNSIWLPNDEGDIFRSLDKGATWTVARQVASEAIENVAFRDQQNGLAIISDENSTKHQLFRTTDGGSTWSRLNYSGPLRGFSIDNVPGTGNYISVGLDFGNGDAGSSYSRDNGQTWVSIETTLNHLFVDAAGPAAVWSGGVGENSAGTIIGLGANKLTSTVLGARTALLVAGASLSPNPSTSGRFRVEWPAAAHVGPVTLTLTDAVGRQVQQRRLESSRAGEASLDLSREKPGLYQVKLESETGVSYLRAQVL